MTEPGFVPLEFHEYPPETMQQRAADLLAELQRRRSVREFSDRPVPRDLIATCIRAAGTAPNGANKQPWHFVAVSDASVKQQIRAAAEAEERAFYEQRAPQDWLDDLAPLGTTWQKPFLEIAPYLIVVLAQRFERLPNGDTSKNYYVQESVGIATGMLITALHHAGLATLTHTPSPMDFLGKILQRPDNERPFLIVVTGYPADDAQVPAITKKPLDDIATFV
ncbi:MAG: nitroreductase family protein [Chloroflexi bacterium]|nr:nitroreductase family protein [Chloroflexota bacterium]